jgi:hypothetical protein
MNPCCFTQRSFAKKKKGERGSSEVKEANRPYQPSDKQSQSIVQVELRILPASTIQIPAGKARHSSDRIGKP